MHICAPQEDACPVSEASRAFSVQTFTVIGGVDPRLKVFLCRSQLTTMHPGFTSRPFNARSSSFTLSERFAGACLYTLHTLSLSSGKNCRPPLVSVFRFLLDLAPGECCSMTKKSLQDVFFKLVEARGWIATWSLPHHQK